MGRQLRNSSNRSPRRHRPLAVIAHHSPDLYGSDLQMLETVTALVDDGWAVTVALPYSGPLVERLEQRGATVRFIPFPSLQKSMLSVAGLARHMVQTMRALIDIRRFLNRAQPDLVLVNTIVIPVWLLAARLGPEHRRSVCHVHEAESDTSSTIQRALNMPLFLAHGLIVNSQAARTAIIDVLPALDRRITILHNGVPKPSASPLPIRLRTATDSFRLVLVGRLSPRKGTDVALESLALLRGRGINAELNLCGSVFPGYEWFEIQLRSRSAERDLAGAITFSGYIEDKWGALATADAVLVPSRVEPFGNTAVEAMHARRPLVTSGVQGLLEIVRDEETGLLVTPEDPVALADAIERLATSPEYASTIADAGWADASARFSVERYRIRMARLLARFRPRG